MAAGAGSLIAIGVAVWLALAELRRARRAAVDAATRKSETSARRVVAWVEAETSFEDGKPAGGLARYLVFNGSAGPIYMVNVLEDSELAASAGVLPPAERPHEVRRVEIHPPHFRTADMVLEVRFTDADRIVWVASQEGSLTRLGHEM